MCTVNAAATGLGLAGNLIGGYSEARQVRSRYYSQALNYEAQALNYDTQAKRYEAQAAMQAAQAGVTEGQAAMYDSQAKYAADMDALNREMAESAINSIQYNQGLQASRVRSAGKSMTGSQKAAMASRGISSASVTYGNILDDSISRSERDALAIQYNADIQSLNISTTAKLRSAQSQAQVEALRQQGNITRAQADMLRGYGEASMLNAQAAGQYGEANRIYAGGMRSAGDDMYRAGVMGAWSQFGAGVAGLIVANMDWSGGAGDSRNSGGAGGFKAPQMVDTNFYTGVTAIDWDTERFNLMSSVPSYKDYELPAMKSFRASNIWG